MTPEEQQSEMSMEDILSSIKDILEGDAENQQQKKEENIVEVMPENNNNQAEAEPEDDVFDLSKSMIIEEEPVAAENNEEAENITPNLETAVSVQADSLIPEEKAVPEMAEENVASEVSLPEDDLSLNIDDILQSASEVMTTELPDLEEEKISEPEVLKAEEEDISLPDFSDIDITSEPILDEEDEHITASISEPVQVIEEEQETIQENIELPKIADAEYSIAEPQEDLSQAHTEIPAAIDEDPQDISIPMEQTEISATEEISDKEENKSGVDVSADIINNFAKMFAEKAQEEKEEVSKAAILPANVSELGNGNKTIEQVVEQVIQGIISASVNAEMTKNVDIVAYAQKEIREQTQAWLEANLPAVVEAAVQKEIERVMAKVGK